MGFYILSYLCVLVFVIAAAALVYRQLTLPVHVRWEIYPVQHESASRAAYGGSYMEEIDWWEKKREKSLVNEMAYMVPEILLIRGLWKENRLLWMVSFPFHFGLYLMIATFFLILAHAVFTLFAPAVITTCPGPGVFLAALTTLTGWTGAVLGTIGACGLIWRRLSDPALSGCSSPADYFNLLFILFFFLSALGCGLSDPTWEGAKSYTLGLITLGSQPASYLPGQNLPGMAAILSASLLAAYIPLTHMSHMFMKYFLYHKVKWDDAPNRPGGPLEKKILANLGFRPTWQARHIGADGRKSWLDIASSAPKEEKK